MLKNMPCDNTRYLFGGLSCRKRPRHYFHTWTSSYFRSGRLIALDTTLPVAGQKICKISVAAAYFDYLPLSQIILRNKPLRRLLGITSVRRRATQRGIIVPGIDNLARIKESIEKMGAMMTLHKLYPAHCCFPRLRTTPEKSIAQHRALFDTPKLLVFPASAYGAIVTPHHLSPSPVAS
jgi:hypothetical protein